jgi:MFS family permease
MTQPVRLGFEANLRQFVLLVVINGFVGAMVGLERTVLPLLAEQVYGLTSHSAALGFIVTFGISKAATNFFAGRLSDRIGRRPTLIAGWLFAIPVPLLVMWAPTWSWILFANVLLGINQGLAWSTTVIMKIDLVGPQRRGFAMGLNEAAGYVAVAVAALASGMIAENFGLRPQPFYLGVAFSAIGLGLSVAFVRETLGHAQEEKRILSEAPPTEQRATLGDTPSAGAIFWETSWKNPALFSASQAGLINNLNDGLAWGIFPIMFAASGLDLGQIGTLAFAYPATWGLTQLWTGALSDRVGRKPLISSGMILQAAALAMIASTTGFAAWFAGSLFLGFGTALVYPTLLAAISDVAHPSWRGSAVGVYRLWRDSGYAFGALLAGIIADQFGLEAAIMVVAGLTLLSGLHVLLRMPETRPS